MRAIVVVATAVTAIVATEPSHTGRKAIGLVHFDSEMTTMIPTRAKVYKPLATVQSLLF